MQDLINVFISHKSEDKAIAELLHRKLEILGQGKIDCFISEKIPYGAEWFKQIKLNLHKADIVILIFTSTDFSWDWPLYEVGLATNLEKAEACKIICIHSPHTNPPDPINYIQAVKGNKEGLSIFFYDFFCTNKICDLESPINDNLRDAKEIKEISTQLEKYFEVYKPSTHYFTYCFMITVNSFPINEKEIPLNAVISNKSSALDLFGMMRRPISKDNWTWGDLMEKIKLQDDMDWVIDLGERFYWASRGDVLKTMTSTLTCLKSNQVYRPILHKTEIKPNGSIKFEVILMVHNPDTYEN